MNSNIKYNSILCEPTLLFETKPILGSTKKSSAIDGMLGLVLPKEHPITKDLSKINVSNALEFYVRRMLDACAYTVCIPAYGHSMWATPRHLKSFLSESGSKRLKFVDRRHSIWSAIEHYLRPVYNDIKKGHSQAALEHSGTPLDYIVWDLYLFSLATRHYTEAPIRPSQTLDNIDKLSNSISLSSESRSRLATIKGTFALFEKATDIPGFRCVAGRSQSFAERIDEILDDAYLLEASRLRRFFGLHSNVRSVKRDLRKIINFISKNSRWAKGLVVATSQAAALPSSTAEALDKVIDLLPGASSDYTAPILIEPKAHLANMAQFYIVCSQRLPFRRDENWQVRYLQKRK